MSVDQLRRWGATPADWLKFSGDLGLTADLLPVVSRIGAEVSPNSHIAAVGKVPSIYNASGKVAGITDWTTKRATPAAIAKWSSQPDYGICIQTRRVRAIDVDIEDIDLAQSVSDRIETILQRKLPLRQRSNSSKFLVAFRMEGEHSKRVVRLTEGNGLIEFLGNGQQFVAVGTHPSGVRYEWLRDEDFPEVSSKEFEAIWTGLEATFADNSISATSTASNSTVAARPSRRLKLANAAAQDPVAVYLNDEGWAHGTDGRDGRLHIRCPFEAEHTTGGAVGNLGGGSATSYFPAHTQGYARGHFRCLHAHCERRTDAEFLEAVGYRQVELVGEFEPLPEADVESLTAGVGVLAEGIEATDLVVTFQRDGRGRLLETLTNTVTAVRAASACGWQIGFDQFRDELMIAPAQQSDRALSPPGLNGAARDWRAFKDTDYGRLRLALEKLGFRATGCSKENVREAVHVVAEEYRFDSAIEWLRGLSWDGVPRVERFMEHYLGAESTPYARAVSRYIWTAMAGRVLNPGCQADMMPIWVGKQGVFKTSCVKAMVPSPDHFVELSLDTHDADIARKMRGCLVAEIGELRGLDSRDSESVKAFISRTVEKTVPKYKEFATSFARRLIMIGTTNKEEFLVDETGHRRSLPIRVEQGDPEAVARDRLQLWAEGAARYAAAGVDWREAEALARGEHAQYVVSDSWEQDLRLWLEQLVPGKDGEPIERGHGWFTLRDVLVGALGFDLRQIDRRAELRLGKILRGLGYEKKTYPKVWKRSIPS